MADNHNINLNYDSNEVKTMKLGILNACTPKEEEEFNEQEFASFQKLFDLAEHKLKLVEYRITEGLFPPVGACDAYLITGSPKGVYDEEAWIAHLGDFIRETYAGQTKMVGICFGHQILAHALGGHAEKSEKGWGLGLRRLQVTGQESWMTPSLPEGAFYYCHQDQVTRLPEGATLLASNEFCPNGMFVLDDRVLGIQGHPEFTSSVMEKAIAWLTENVDIPLKSATATLDHETPDRAVMAQWIVNFLNG